MAVILLGAGASFGSEDTNRPPLGDQLFGAIKDINIGPRFVYPKPLFALQKPFSDQNSASGRWIQNISIQEWVADVSPSALTAFGTNGFEAGMNEILGIKPSFGMYALDILSRENEHSDASLPAKIMQAACTFLYQFEPTENNLYYDLLESCKDKSRIYTLNYDCLIEDCAAKMRINLEEINEIDKVCRSQPVKTIFYGQLHGGITLCSSWRPYEGLHGMHMESGAQRICRNSLVGYFTHHPAYDPVMMKLGSNDYMNIFSKSASLAYYEKNKQVVVAPSVIKKIQKEYSSTIQNYTGDIIIIGCRYLDHDDHIWGPIRTAPGKIFFCGDSDSSKRLGESVEYIGPYFKDSLPRIIEILNR